MAWSVSNAARSMPRSPVHPSTDVPWVGPIDRAG